MSRNVTFRPATKNDAQHLAHLVNFAGEGIPYYFWQKNAESGQDPWDIGKNRAEREEGSFSYRHTIVAEIDGELAGCLVTYVLPEDPEPIDYDEMPPIFVPIQELEDSAPSTQYVSVLAAYPQYRNLGVGSGLLKIAEKEGDGRAMSIIVSDGNPNARRLYERVGYVAERDQKMVKEDWKGEGKNWILMIKA
ncbi:GNAT family N-acetyltransferase [uncultured Sneathiella sp.]|jgi:ribosomal protein S18 acetylase RimI-like enzyme|uniref:GNAT family N-acetyltransferase n=1 Tax=uncultured Sneathiella sp. TaxID=879315 RepID=UPI0030D91291|tara:strand:- start:569 stop:1144 length:576 start_codon:yes stop_codon:yes gene_type:complete